MSHEHDEHEDNEDHEWQYLLKTLLMWLWQVRILMDTMMTMMKIEIGEDDKRSDGLWRFFHSKAHYRLNRNDDDGMSDLQPVLFGRGGTWGGRTALGCPDTKPLLGDDDDDHDVKTKNIANVTSFFEIFK